jgi:hypothetical protein
MPTRPVGMTPGAHGVLTKNKNSDKIFYSRPYNHLPQKISCGRTTIFARIVHIRAKGRDVVFFENLIAEPRTSVTGNKNPSPQAIPHF